MKKFYFTFIFCLLANFAYGLDLIHGGGQNFALSEPLGNTSVRPINRVYEGRDFVRFLPGFSFAATERVTLHARIARNPNDPFYAGFDPDGSIVRGHSVGAIAANLSVSPTGGAIHTIPISVPVGVNGMQPQIAIIYNSQSGNGVVGWGTNISGISAITRVPRSIFYDGVAGGVTHNAGDALALDGQRLILVEGETGINGAVYSPANDPFTRITFNNNSFEVKTRDGMRYIYGSTADSRQNFADGLTNAWFLSRAIDLRGNTIIYNYERHNLFIYLRSIYYGNNSVRFYYEERPDITHFRLGTTSGSMNRRLSSIVSQRTSNNIYRRYVFEYTNNDHFSRLSSVTKRNAAGEALNPVHFRWNYLPSFQKRVENVNLAHVNVPINDQTFFAMDLNGDGLDDIVSTHQEFLNYQNNFRVYNNFVNIYKAFRDSNGEVRFRHVPPSDTNSSYSNNTFNSGISFPSVPTLGSSLGKLAIDVNGDGINELLIPTTTATTLSVPRDNIHAVKFSFFCNMFSRFRYGYSFFIYEVKRPLTRAPLFTTIDMNNDGRGSVFILERGQGGNNRYYGQIRSLNQNGGWHYQNFYLTLISPPQEIFAADFNGDGMTDIMIVGGIGYSIFWNRGNGMFSNEYSTFDLTVNTGNNLFPFGGTPRRVLRMGDFNGDGLPDFLMNMRDSDRWYFALNNGNGIFDIQFADNFPTHNQPFTEHDDHRVTLLVYDFDGDGKSDVVFTKAIFNRRSNSWGQVWGDYYHTETLWLRSTGTRLELERRVISNSNPSHRHQDLAMPRYFVLGDFDGDGRQEIMNYGLNIINGGDDIRWRMYRNPLLEASSGKLMAVRNAFDFSFIEYAHLTDPSVYTKGRNSTYPLADIQVALPVVRSITSQNGLGDRATVSYKYKGARVHLQGRGFLGFTTTTTENSLTGARTETTVNSLHSTFFAPLRVTSRTTIGGRTAESTTEFTYRNHTNSNGRRHLALPSRLTETDFYGNRNTTAYYFDTWGNIVQERTEFGDPANFRQIDYWRFIQAGGTIPNRPQRIRVTQRHSDDTETFMNTTAFDYNTFGELVTKTENYGTDFAITTRFAYNSVGNLSSHRVQVPGKPERFQSFSYDPSNRFVVGTNAQPSGVRTTFTHDTWGNLLTENDRTNPSAVLTTTHTYDSWGRRTRTTLPDGRVTNFSRGWGDSAERRFFTRTQGTGQPTVTTWFDAAGRKVSTETTGAKNLAIESNHTHNERGQLIRSETRQGDLVQYVEFEHDDFGRTTRETHSTGRKIRHTFGNREVSTITNGRTHRRTFDAWGNVRTATDPGGTITFNYFSNNRPSSIRLSGSPVMTAMSYDAVGNQTGLCDPNAGFTAYKHNALGQLVKQVDNIGNVTRNYYDHLNRLERSVLNGVTTYYTYGTSGYSNLLLVRVQKENTIIEYEHDRFGRITKETRTIEGIAIFTVEFTYDPQTGNLASRRFVETDLKERFFYDSNGNLIRVIANDIIVWELAGNTGTETTVRLADRNITRRTTFDANGLLSRQKTTTNNNQVILNMNYNFCPLTGNLTSRSGMFEETEYFEYDDLDRLIYISRNSISIDFDSQGNITYKTNIGEFTYNSSDRPHAVREVENVEGLISGEEQIITFNAFHSPEFIREGNYTLELIYGPDQQRWKTILKNDGNIIKTAIFAPGYERVIYPDGTTRHFHYIHGSDGLAAVYMAISPPSGELEGAFFYAHTDHLGSILRLTDRYGEVVFSAAFDAWGNKAEGGINDINFRRGFTGHEHLPEFGLINMNGRMYDPLLGRMLSPDNFVQSPFFTQSHNRYSYVWNNPLRFVDPTGELVFAGFALAAVLNAASWGAVIAATTYTLSVAVSDGGFNNWNWGDFGKSVGFGALSGAVSFGIGEAFSVAGNFAGSFTPILKGTTHGFAQGTMSVLQGGDFLTGFVTGALGSWAASGYTALGLEQSLGAAGMIGFSALTGGVTSWAMGGCFLEGAAIGATVSALNHWMHSIFARPTVRRYAQKWNVSEAEAIERLMLQWDSSGRNVGEQFGDMLRFMGGDSFDMRFQEAGVPVANVVGVAVYSFHPIVPALTILNPQIPLKNKGPAAVKLGITPFMPPVIKHTISTGTFINTLNNNRP